MLSLDKPLPRGPFLAAGLALMAAKVAIDFAISGAFSRPFSLVFYISPVDNPFFSPHAESVATGTGGGWAFPRSSPGAYWLTMVGVALPFILAGVGLIVRRLRDAGLPGLLAGLFFLPFVKFLFFAWVAAAPSKSRAPRTLHEDMGPFRSATVDLGPPPERTVGEKGQRRVAILVGALAGTGTAMAAMGVSIGLLKDYGAPLMMATPAVAGFVATSVYGRLCRPTFWGVVLVTLLTFALGMTLLALAAIEGFGCIAMAFPLFLGEAFVGSALAGALATSRPGPPTASVISTMAILPLTFAANRVSPLPPERADPIESEIVVHAPPDVVWKRVVSFPPLAPPTEALFRIGVAAPLSASIDGEGVGAVRRCEFTTGTFVEPIEVWTPGRELSFSVAKEPDPMREWTLYPGPRPLHLNGYLESTRGQFVLEPLRDGSTRLIGRTWYRVHMAPVAYWRLWGDPIIHAIHMRVLRHVAELAEADARVHTASP